MPYELVLLRFKQGEIEEVPTEPLLEVLARHGITDISSEYHQTIDGLSIELPTSCLCRPTTTDILISFRGISLGLFELVFDLAKATSMTVIVMDNPSIPLVLDSDAAANLPEANLADPLVCDSPKEIAAAVIPAFEAWDNWVDSASWS